MSVAVFISPIERKVDACEKKEESWKLNHDLAMQALNLQDLLRDVVECYDELQQFDRYVFEQVKKGKSEYDDDLDQSLISLCSRLHRLFEEIDGGLLPWFENQFDSIEYAEEFRNRLQRARESKKFGYRRDAHLQNRASGDRLWELIEAKY